MQQQDQQLGSLVDEFDRGREAAAPSKSGRGGGLGEMRRVLVGGVSLLIVIGALAFLAMRAGGGPPDAGAMSRKRVAKDAVTGQVFEDYRITEGDAMPWAHPSTGERTLYPVEKCYWAPGGGAKAKPTFVILNDMLGEDGPTICPDCGREVIRHNPLPPEDALLKALQDAKARGEL